MASGNGFLGKFKERLRRIRISRVKKIKQEREKDYISDIGKSIKGRPYVVVRGRGIADNKVIRDKKYDNSIKISTKNIDNDDNKKETVVSNKYKGIVDDDNKISDKDSKNRKISGVKEKINNNKKVFINDEKLIKELDKIEEDLLVKIRKNFEDKLDELEILESELYLLSIEKDNAIVREKIKIVKEKIDVFINELNSVIDQYNAYRKNYYIDNIISIDDNNIVDDLIKYRFLLNDLESEKDFVSKYKKLVQLRLLYNQIKKIKDEVEKLRDDTEKKEIDIEERDKKYEEIKKGLMDNDDINKRCLEEIERQNAYFDDLMKKISNINREEYTTYHLRGIDELVGMSLRYVGLMLVSPLSGFIPGIAMQTLATRNFIRNIRGRLHFEEVNHVHYDAVDYDSELNQKLTDINYTSDLIDDTLKDIGRLREDFMKQYNSNIPGYEDTLEKINKIEDKIFRNQNKVSKIKDMINGSKKVNSEKLVRVRELNNSN